MGQQVTCAGCGSKYDAESESDGHMHTSETTPYEAINQAAAQKDKSVGPSEAAARASISSAFAKK